MSDALNDACKRILSYFGKLPSQGFLRLKGARNRNNVRGVYVFECSLNETMELEQKVSQEHSLTPIIEHLRFYECGSSRSIQIEEQVNEPAFVDAVNTHNVNETIIVCAWIYNGIDANESARESEDFGVVWAAVTFQ